jgi:hypothetical protein
MGLLFSGKSKRIIGRFISVFSLAALLIGCAAGQQAQKSSQDGSVAQTEPATPTLEAAYRSLVVYEIETKPELKRDYEQALGECRSTLMTSLLEKNKFDRVEPAKPGATYGEIPTLIVKIYLTDMRIAGSTARFWGGAFAGSSFMNMNMKLVDAATGKVLREEYFNSANNAWAAAFTFGASDRSLPSDMGKIMAEYIAQVVPAK